MASTNDTAEEIIRIFVSEALDRKRAWLTYKELAEKLGRPGQQRLLQQALDRSRELCRERGLPEFASLIVSETSVKAGTLLPADQAIEKYGGLAALRQEQGRVISFDWSTVGAT